jgi:trehalose 6-phosphate synthase/phosphatase
MARKIIVSNRLPFSFKKVDGKLTYQQGGGGLATALSSYTKGGNSLWIGWPGLPSDDLSEDDKTEITEILKKHNLSPRLFIAKTD